MKQRIYKVICVFLIAVLAFGCCTTIAQGKSNTVKMKVYNDVIKDGNTVYFSTPKGIYKVNIKKGTKKRIVKKDPMYGEGRCYGMKLKKGYLYFLSVDPGANNLERVKKSGKSHRYVWSGVWIKGYVIKDKKIYVKYEDEDSATIKKKMSLKGKNAKKTCKKIKTTFKHTNKKGYKKVRGPEDENGKVKYYLKTPKKKIYITTTYSDAGWD